MSLPSPNLTVPSLSNGQASFNGFRFGSGTPFLLKKAEGLDLPNVRKGNTSFPRSRGSLVGLNLADIRDITLTMDIGPQNFGSYGTLAGALEAMAKSFAYSWGTTEYPLWYQAPNWPLLCAMVRVTKKTLPQDYPYYAASFAQNIPIQFEATDPWLYAAPTLAPVLSLGAPSTGLSFPIGFPLSFGGSASPNTTTCTNSGSVPCWPTLVIAGPCLNPQVQNLSIAGSPYLTFAMQLNSGDELVVNCDYPQSAVFFPSGSTTGSSALGALTAGSQFFAIEPPSMVTGGANVIQFSSGDTSSVAGTCTVQYSSTWDQM